MQPRLTMPTRLACLLLWLLMLLPARPALAQIEVGESEVEGAGGGAGHGAAAIPTVSVVLSRMHSVSSTTTGGSRIQISCSVTPPGRFMAWMKNDRVIGTNATLEIPTSGSHVLGDYLCTAESTISHNQYRAARLVITEMPLEDRRRTVAADPLQLNVTLSCPLTSSNDGLRWYTYNDTSYQFELIGGAVGQDLSTSHVDNAFYKCANSSDLSGAIKVVIEHNMDGLTKDMYRHVMRDVPTDVAAVPVAMPQGSGITLECPRPPIRNESRRGVAWFFRGVRTDSENQFKRLTDSDANIQLQFGPSASLLSIRALDVARNEGYYRCTFDGTVKHAFVDVTLIRPTIHEYSKGIYNISGATKSMQELHELDCEIPLGGDVRNLIWRILPAAGSAPFDIPVNASRRGFQTHSRYSSQLVSVKFPPATSQLDNYRLECRFGEEIDYVTIKSLSLFKIAITVSDTQVAEFKQLSCSANGLVLTNIKFYGSNERYGGAAAVELLPSNPCQWNATSCIHWVSQAHNVWLRCSGETADDPVTRIFSEAVSTSRIPLTLDLFVDGALSTCVEELAVTRCTVARLRDQATELICAFSNTRDSQILPENVRLEINNRAVQSRPIQTDNETFKFLIDNQQLQVSGTYYCSHIAGSSLMQRARSQEFFIRWCESDQFVCDSQCRDKGIVCNGDNDCADGSDEAPTLCFRFEISASQLNRQPSRGDNLIPRVKGSARSGDGLLQPGLAAASIAGGLILLLALVAAASAMLVRAAWRRRRRTESDRNLGEPPLDLN